MRAPHEPAADQTHVERPLRAHSLIQVLGYSGVSVRAWRARDSLDVPSRLPRRQCADSNCAWTRQVSHAQGSEGILHRTDLILGHGRSRRRGISSTRWRSAAKTSCCKRILTGRFGGPLFCDGVPAFALEGRRRLRSPSPLMESGGDAIARALPGVARRGAYDLNNIRRETRC
jgi:hypothetical protein